MLKRFHSMGIGQQFVLLNTMTAVVTSLLAVMIYHHYELHTTAMFLHVATFVVLLAFIYGLNRIVARYIIAPLDQLNDHLFYIEQGNFEHEFALTGLMGEIAEEEIIKQKEQQRSAVESLSRKFKNTFGGKFYINEETKIDLGPVIVSELWSGSLQLSGNNEMMDEVTQKIGAPVSIFIKEGSEFIRVATTLKNEHGERVIGTTLGIFHPAYQLLMDGQDFYGVAQVFGKNFAALYTPVKNTNNEVVAVLVTGKPSSKPETRNQTICMATKLQTLVSKYEALLLSIINTSKMSEESADKLTQSIEIANELSGEQKTKTEQAVQVMEQMHVRSQGLYENSTKASDLAQKADEESIGSKQVIEMVLHMFQSFSDYITETHAVVENLVQDCEKMSGITEVINQLTEQTNLLALNAAIEAARAGEQGRGFAVVADEVRSLATRTRDSANDIMQNIDSVQVRANDTANIMHKQKDEVSKGLEKAHAAGEALSIITDAVHEIKEFNVSNANYSSEQTEFVSEMKENTDFIADIANQVLMGNSEIENSAKKMSEITQKLNSIANQFQLHTASDS